MNKDVAYDSNFSINNHRGMGKYINNYVRVLKQVFKTEPLGLLRPQKSIQPSNHIVFGFSNYIFWEQFSLLKFRKQFKGIVIFPYNTAPLFLRKSCLNVLFVHDLIFLNRFNSASFKQKLGAIYRSVIVPRIINKFDHIVTVSEYSKRQICSLLNVKENNISVIPNAINLETGFEVLNPKYSDRENFIFHIGGEPDYKNSIIILLAFAALPVPFRDGLHIKMIGIRNKNILNKFISQADELGIRDKIQFLDYQTDEQISELYRKAKMFIFPSFEEGFGIPLIESMKFGCPLLCSSRSCLPEIAGEAGHYFNPSDANSLSKKIIAVLKDSVIVEKKIQLGYQKVLNYSYDEFERKVTDWFNNIIRE
jgi:glycosyltransferase involved in cell wall biosynthesis